MTDPEMMARIKSAVEELAALNYPRVWIGEPGMTLDEYFSLELMNEQDRRESWEGMTQQEQRELLEEMPTDLRERLSEEVREEPPKKWEDLPEWLRNEMKGPLEVQPGELVALDESEELGVQVPKVHEYLDGLYVVENMRDEMEPHVYAELESEVGYIRAAKQGRVRIQIAWDLEFKPLHLLTEEDQLFTTAITEEGLAMVYLGSRYADVPLDELSPEAVDDELLETLEFYTSESMGPYVIEDSEKARHALDKRLAEE